MRNEKAICPNCEGSSLSCDLCHGTGRVAWDVYFDFIDKLMEADRQWEAVSALAYPGIEVQP